ncbi:hypothetical protein ACIQ6K_37260 [Streptomyces sp. NPDC096354]|uniref:hypothetical protein n=1 Tax=Streptomyces sp. NPDC096354 TaxID=3366088 RepID=UPI003802D65E
MATSSAVGSEGPARLIHHLTRAAHHAPETATGLIAVIRADSRTYLPLALAMACYGAGPVDTALATVVEGTHLTFEECCELEELIPLNTGVLPNAALAIAVQHCRRAGSNAQLAVALRRLGNRLGAVGRYGEALAATEEAVELCRELVAFYPDAHTSDLAGALLTDRFRMKFGVGLGSWVLFRQDLVSAC